MGIELNKIYNVDCFEGVKHIPDGSIDLVLTDMPYNKTQNKWDYDIDIEHFWDSHKRLIKRDGVIVLTSVQPFTSKLVMSNLPMFRYELIWEKNRGTDFLNANIKPLSNHENIIVFYNHKPTYNPQWTYKKPYKRWNTQEAVNKQTNYGKHKSNISESKDGKRYPKTVLKFNRVERPIQPTQKPLELFEWIIKTYTNTGDIVLDSFVGSGTTALACLNLQRKFIAFEKNNEYYTKAIRRIKGVI